MKILLALVPLTWSTCMPSTYTPNPNSSPATISLPSAGDPVASAVADQAWKDVADRTAFTVAFADIAGMTGAVDGTLKFAAEIGWYKYSSTTPYTADGTWVITATGMGAGQWIHQSLVFTHLKKMPAVGPTPGDVGFVIPTPAGKINPQFESFALIERNDQGPGLAFTMTRPFADPTTLSDEGPATTLSTVPRVGDVVRVNAGVGVTCADVFRVAALISQDSSATYTLVTPRVTSTLPVTWANSTGNYVYVGLSFDYVVAASPAPTGIRISFRMQSNGGVSATARFNAYITELRRP